MRGISLCQPPALKKAVLAEESPRFCFATALPTAFRRYCSQILLRKWEPLG
jgi:hypothetical protein